MKPKISDLCEAFQHFQIKMTSILMLAVRNPEEWKKKRTAALKELEAEFNSLGLPTDQIDWSVNDD